jgi:hypothetical protein
VLRLIALVLLAALAGCLPPTRPGPPDEVPLLRLAPSALPGGMAAQQRLSFEHGGRRQVVDALVEVDAEAVRVVIHAQGQVALRLDWDGSTLTQTRADWLPPQLSAERVLSDLQLVYWPVDAVDAALPPAWHFSGPEQSRKLMHSDEIVAHVQRVSEQRRVLRQNRHRYMLQIDSVPVIP